MKTFEVVSPVEGTTVEVQAETLQEAVQLVVGGPIDIFEN
jgi:hypothetical protein